MESQDYPKSSNQSLIALNPKADGDLDTQSGTSSEMAVEDKKVLELFILEPLYVYSFATILENTIEELKILGSCNNTLQLFNIEAKKTQLLHDKYGMKQTAVEDELEGISRDQLGKQEYKLKKLVADRLLFQDTVSKTYIDLALNNSFESLVRQTASIQDRATYHARLAEEETANRATRRQLLRQLRAQRNHMRAAQYEVDVIIDSLKARIEDSSVFAESRNRYAGKWQSSRTEQHEASIQEAQAKPLNSILLYRQKIADEERVHSGIMLLNSFDIDEKLNQVDEVMSKYDDHIENMELQIQIMRNNHEVQKETREELQEKYKYREKQIDGWISFKRVREDERLRREKLNNAAITVQAWWRGLLVRLQLGPFKSRKKGHKRNKK